jgi:hypothetical protein
MAMMLRDHHFHVSSGKGARSLANKGKSIVILTAFG